MIQGSYADRVSWESNCQNTSKVLALSGSGSTARSTSRVVESWSVAVRCQLRVLLNQFVFLTAVHIGSVSADCQEGTRID